MRVKHLKFLGVFAAALLGLNGCAVLEGDGEAAFCPPTAILDEPGELVRFKGGTAPGPANVMFRTKMKSISGLCDFDEETIVMDLGIAMRALRGPANKEGKAEFVYFVAILQSDRKVLTRQEFPMLALFENQDTQIDFVESVTVTIPRRKGTAPTDYLVYLGFEMTPEELAYNRRRLGRRAN